MLVQIVSRERAEAEETMPQQVLWIADWHEDRLAEESNEYGAKKPPTKTALKPHRRLAAELRALAQNMLSDVAGVAAAP